MKRMLAITCAGALVLALASCSSLGLGGNKAQTGSANSSGSVSSSSSASGSVSSGSSSASGSGSDASGADGSASDSSQNSRSATLYIGMNGEFKEYPLEAKEEVNYYTLVAGIAELTGWNLDLESAVEGNGKIVISFADTSSLFVGPPEEQKEEFRVLDAGQLDQTILDSVQKTIQEWVGTEDGEAEVYFTAADGGDLVLSGIGVTISADEPYTGFPTASAAPAAK